MLAGQSQSGTIAKREYKSSTDFPVKVEIDTSPLLPQGRPNTLPTIMPTESSSFPFPAPIGGVPLHSDLGPCILFAILFAALVVLAINHVRKPESRNITAFMATAFVIERQVITPSRTLNPLN